MTEARTAAPCPAPEARGDDFAAAARRAAVHVVKARARAYDLRPQTLDALHPGLSLADPP